MYCLKDVSVFKNFASPPKPANENFSDFLVPSDGFKKLSVSLEDIL